MAPITQNGRKAKDLSYKYRYDERDDASGVDIYIVDTGLEMMHPDFGGRAKLIFANQRDALWKQIDHGTHVAGIAGSIHYGAAKNASIYGIKVFTEPDPNDPDDESKFAKPGDGKLPPPAPVPDDDFKDIAAGIQVAIKQHSRKRKEDKNFKGSVMNLSWGYSPEAMAQGKGSTLLKDILKKAVDAGIHITIAPGNDNKDACTDVPAGYVKELQSLIVVGNSDITDTKAAKSDWGPCIDLHAPGEEIMSTFPIDQEGVSVDSGTSMAAPLVAGVIAGELVKNPQLRYDPMGMKNFIKGKALKGVVKGAERGGNLLLNTGMKGNPM
ncbi:Cerevisin [Dactylellina cionopaga]|nr:Cerevisin [Dactylellina cionopaga]